MHILLRFLKIVLEIAFIMIIYYITANFFPVLYKVCILCWFAVSILILLFNYNFFSILFTKKEKTEKKQLLLVKIVIFFNFFVRFYYLVLVLLYL